RNLQEVDDAFLKVEGTHDAIEPTKIEEALKFLAELIAGTLIVRMQNQESGVVGITLAGPIQFAIGADGLEPYGRAEFPIECQRGAPIVESTFDRSCTTVSKRSEVPSRIVRTAPVDRVLRHRRRRKCRARASGAGTDCSRECLILVDGGENEWRS